MLEELNIESDRYKTFVHKASLAVHESGSHQCQCTENDTHVHVHVLGLLLFITYMYTTSQMKHGIQPLEMER